MCVWPFFSCALLHYESSCVQFSKTIWKIHYHSSIDLIQKIKGKSIQTNSWDEFHMKMAVHADSSSLSPALPVFAELAKQRKNFADSKRTLSSSVLCWGHMFRDSYLSCTQPHQPTPNSSCPKAMAKAVVLTLNIITHCASQRVFVNPHNNYRHTLHLLPH